MVVLTTLAGSGASTPRGFIRQSHGKPPGDLLRALVILNAKSDAIGAIAEHFGYNLPATTAVDHLSPSDGESQTPRTPTTGGQRARKPVASELVALAPDPDAAAGETQPDWVSYVMPLSAQRSDPVYRRPIEPLFDPRLTRALLTGAAARSTESGEVDLEALVTLIAQGTLPKVLPRRLVSGLGHHVQLLIDSAPAMQPFFADLDQLIDAAVRFIGLDRLRLARFRGCPCDGLEARDGVVPYMLPAPGDCVLAVTTLGIDTLADSVSAADWITFAETLARQDCALTAIVPYPLDRVPRELVARLRVLSWDRSTGVRDLMRRTAQRKTDAGTSGAPAPATARGAETASTRASPAALELAERACLAARAEPQLLRTLRLNVKPALDVAAETDLFWSDAVEARGSAGIVLRAELLPWLRQRLRESPELLDACWNATKALHQNGSRAILYEEELTYLTLRGLVDPGRAERAKTILRELVVSLLPRSGVQLALWGERAVLRLPAELFGKFEEARMLASGLGRGVAARVFSKLPSRVPVGEYRWLGGRSGVAMAQCYVRLVEGGIEFDPRLLPQSHEIAVPEAGVVQAELRWNTTQGQQQRIISVDRARPEVVEINAERLEEIDIHVFGGPSYRLRRPVEVRDPARADAPLRVYISAVSSEFGKARDAIASDLRARGATVHTQRDFSSDGDAESTLKRLHDYIKDCSALIFLIGQRGGALPRSAAAAPFANMLPEGMSEASYLQWEWIFARYYRRRIHTFMAADDYKPDFAITLDRESPERQSKFISYLREEGHDWTRFSNVEALRIAVSKLDWSTGQKPERPPTSKPIILPYPSLGPLFKGRDGFMRQLHERLSGKGKTAITANALYGLAGIGKTRAAVEYAWAHRDDYTALLFVMAETPDVLRRNLAALTAMLTPELDTPDDAVRLQATLDWLRTHPGWLMILDGVDSRDAMAEAEQLIPRLGAGSILITSRFADVSASVDPISLDEFNLDDAAAFLIERTKGSRRESPDDATQARALAQELGQHPLGLEQAGAYVSKRRLTFAQYLQEWRTNRDKVMAWRDPTITGYSRDLAVTLDMSLAQLTRPGRRLLDAVAWLAPDKVPESLLDVPLPGAESENLHDALEEIAGYSLITRDPEGPYFLIHRSVQDMARRGQTRDRRSSIGAALRWIDSAFEGDPADVRSWPRLEPLAPHVHTVVTGANVEEIAEPTSSLMTRLGILYDAKGLYREAEPLFGQALAIEERSLGPDHPRVAARLNNLAMLLHSTNRRVEAEPLLRRALAIQEKNLGSGHSDTAISLVNLASIARDTGRLSEAEFLIRRALDLQESSLGPHHPNVARSLNEFASILNAKGQFAEAEPMVRRAFAIDEKSFGPDHPNVARSLGAWASTLMATKRLDEAEPLLRRALEIDEKSFGPDHPRVASDLANLAQMLAQTDRTIEAISLYRQALRRTTREQAPFLWSGIQVDLGDALYELGARERSATNLHEAVAAYRAALQGEPVPSAATAAQSGLQRAEKLLSALSN